ncbi:MAG TPA: tripartite tricarboxylate transporter TctB family protein [Paracoccaceae bacterium]|nr:tripartite tricarboxylate transporter TctB family protein [Paracoccaceae bacterium]
MSTGNPRRPDRPVLVIAAALFALAALIVWQTREMQVAATYARVGPRQFPYVVAAGLAALGVGTVIAALRGSFPEREKEEFGPMAWIVAGLVIQMLILRTAGFSVATGILFALSARGFGRRPVWLSFLIGTVFSFLIWILFARGLQLSLPAGPLERLFF